MRIIPVIDLLDGRAVHAVKGRRNHYQPLKSVLCNSPDPLAVAGAYRNSLGLNEVYVADLNAIQGFPRPDHNKMIETLAGRAKMNVLLDAGASDAEGVRLGLDLGVHKVIIGTETLRNREALQEIPAAVHRNRLVFSLDLHAGRIFSRCSALQPMQPMALLEQLRFAGWKEIVILDLRRVGSGMGTDRNLAIEVRKTFPDIALLIGGGVSAYEELIELKTLGIAGVLIATSLHCGIINARHIANLGTSAKKTAASAVFQTPVP
jgi:phosphoribosylformimino-5-aminoimidazole carboxamide ribotide isomerase